MIEWLIIGIVIGGLGGYVVSIRFNAYTKQLKAQVSYWQGMYGSLLRQLESSPQTATDMISEILNNPIVKMILPKLLERYGINMQDLERLR